MTEPKVVHAHKWDDDDGWGHLVRTDGGYYQGAECEEHEDRRFDLVDEIPVDVAIELARLAARVEEFWCTIANQKAEIIRLLDVLEDIRDHRTKYPGDAEQEMIDMAGVAILGGDPTP